MVKDAFEKYARGRNVSKLRRGGKGGRKFAFLRYTAISSLLASTVVITSFAGVSRAAITIDTMQFPLLAIATSGVVGYDIEDASSILPISAQTDVTAAAITKDRKLFTSNATSVLKLNSDGTRDESFAEVGYLNGFTNVTALSIDERSDRLYVLDAGESSDPTVVVMTLTGDVLTTTSVPGAVHLISGFASVVTFGATLSDAVVWTNDMATQTPLNLDVMIDSSVQVADVIAAPPASLDNLTQETSLSVAIADQAIQTVQRFVIVNPMSVVPTLTEHDQPAPLAVSDVTALAMSADQTLFVALGGQRMGDIIRIFPNNEVDDEPVVRHSGFVSSLVVASFAKDIAQVVEEEPQVVNRSVSVSNVSCTPTTSNTGRYTVAKFINTDAACEYGSLPDTVTAIDVLAVGGGGGGGAGQSAETSSGGGGGGAAQLVTNIAATPSSSWLVDVGAGGVPGWGSCCGGNEASGDSGESTTFGDIVVNGGAGSLRTGLGGTAGAGGTANVDGVAGGNGGARNRGAGGVGNYFNITGLSVCYGAGGGGGANSTSSTGGVGGCGVASNTGQFYRGTAGGNTLADGISAQNATNLSHFGGDIYRGHGGGGASGTGSGGAGGPGVVYVRYAALPVITGPIAVTQEATKNATFSVTATAGTATTAAMTYQWRKDGLNIAGEISSTLTVAAIDMDDAGLYDVIVTNDDGAGKTSSSTSVTASLTVEPRSFNFKIGSLTVSTTNRTALEVGSYTGDDRGGMAISSSKAFLLGDTNLAAFDKNVTSGTLASTTATRLRFTQLDSIVSDVKAQKAYVFNRVNTTSCGAVASPCFTKLTELNATTGAMTATEIQLSSPIPHATSSGDYYAGYGRVVYRNGGTGVVYDVDLPSGDVTVVGTRSISRTDSENNGQAWGVAEYFDGDLWLAYAASGFIRRTNVRTGTTQDIVVCNCSDLASFVVDPSLNRWYFHWEGNSSSFNFGVDETFGYASATFETLPAASIAPASTLMSATSTTFTVQFDDAVTGIAADDFSLSGTSTGWAITGVTALSASRYTVTATQTNGTSGTLILSLRSGAAAWTAGGGTAIPSSTVSSSAVTVDQTAPTASFTTVPANFLSSAASTFTLTFSEAISGLAAGDFSNAGTAENCVFAPASSTGTTINVSVSGCGDGSLELRLAANSVTDAAGNAGPASAVTAASRFVDATPGAPVMTFSHSNPALTSSSTLTYTLTSNEPITGLTASDITNVGSAQNCNIAVTGTQPGTSFTVTVTNCGDGTVVLRLARESVTDGAGVAGPTTSGVSVNTVVTTISGSGSAMYSAPHPDGTKLYVVNETGSVRVIELATNTQLASATVDVTPRGIAVTPNGAFVYVANYSSNTVSKISTATNTVVATISAGSSPNGLAVTPDGTKVLLANVSGNSVTVIDTATDAVSATIALGRAPWNIKVSPNSLTAYTSNYNSNTVSVINLLNNSATTHISVSSAPYELGINRAGTRVYVANYSGSSVSVIDTSTNTVIHTVMGLTNPMGIGVSSDDQTIYVNGYGSQQVKWFDASTYAINAGSMATGSNPWGLSMSPDGSRGYVSSRGGTVTVFSAAGEVQTTTVTVDQAPPTASFTTVPAAPLSSSASTYTLTFSKAITGLIAGDFSNAGSAQNCVFAPASSSGTVINVTVSGCGDGTLELALAANSVSDSAGNTGPATAVTAASRYVDAFPGIPTLSFSAQSTRVSNATSLSYTLTANEPVSGLTASDIINVGTAQNCDISVSGSQPGTSFTVTAAGCGDGNVVLRLARDSVVDRAGLAGPNVTVATRHAVVTSFSGQGNTYFSVPSPDGSKVFFTVTNTNRVRIYDTATRTLSATQFTTGSAPRGIAVSPDGQTLYVANYSANTVSVLNASTGATLTSISVPASPNGLALSVDGSRLFVANLGGNSLSVIDTANNTIVGTVALGRSPWSVRVSADGRFAYTGNYATSTVSVINVATLTKVTDITVQAHPYEIELNRDDSRLYVANYGSHSVSVINTSNNTVIRTVSGVFNGPMGLTVSQDNQTVYVANHLSNTVRWFDASSYTNASGTMSITGSNAYGMSMSPNGLFNYVTTEGGGFNVFHTENHAESQLHTLDRTAPTATFSTVPTGPLSTGSSVFTLSFTESITGLIAGDFTNAGNALNCVFTPASSSGTVINVTVSGCGEGNLELQLTQNSVVDVAGNTGPANAVTAASRYVDAFPGPPLLSFTQNPASPNSSATLTFTLTSNERVSGLTADDIINVGTAQGCEYSISGTQPGTTLQVAATNCGDGTVQLRLVNGAVVDGAGNLGPASGGAANTLIQQVTGVTTTMYSAAHPDGTKLYIAAQGASQVRVMNTSTNIVTANIAVGTNPRGIAVTPNGEFVYVANHSSNTVSKISTASNTVVRTISVGTSPLGLAITPDGTKVVVVNRGGNSVTVINTATDSAASTISLGLAPWNIKVSPDGRFAYTGNVSNSSVTVINLQTNTVVQNISVGSSPHELGINRSGTRVYAANYSSSSVSVIDTSTNTVIRTVTGISNPMGIMTSIDDRTVYVVSYGSQRVRWFDANSYAVSSGQIVVQSAAWGLEMSPDGAKGYVSNYSSGSVTVFAAEGFVQSSVIQFDRNAPTVTSFESNTNSPNDLTEQTWTVQFSEAVTGLSAADFVVGGTSTGWSSPVVSGTGTTYTVSVSHSNPAEGTITIALAPSSVSDIASNTGPATSTSGTTLTWRVGQGVFKINSLTTSNVTALEVVTQTGDDRGGIALTTDRALLTGDSGMGRFDLSNLANGARAVSQTSTWMDAIVTDVKTLRSYAFNLNATRNGSLTTLTQLDPLTGLLSSTVITLSSGIPVSGSGMIFAGYSRVAIWTGGILYDISLPSGQVTSYGAFAMPTRQSSENWASWGVVEYFSGQLHLVYNSNGTTISRVNVATGAVSTVFTNPSGFSDMASFVVNPRSNRWYFHYEGRAGAFNFGSDETLGFADATFNIGGLPPESVTNLSVSTRSSTAVLTWDAPATGPTPTDYVIQSSTNGGATWRWVNDGVSTSTTASISGFTPGATVRFRVATVSDVNASPYLVSLDSLVSPFATAPTITSVNTANTSLSVAFTAPASAGASAINTYQYSLDGGTTWVARNAGTTASPLVINGLTNGTEYSVLIRAVNTQGGGEASVAVTGTPTTTASAPAITSISPTASGTLTVAFDAPTSDGGTSVTNYQYSINNGSTWITRNPVSTSSPLVVAGLSNGSTYNVVLRAVNARGTGLASTSVLATAGIVALAPSISSVSSGDGTISVVFTPPTYNGGLTISNYEYSSDNGTTWTARNPASTTSPLTISGLTNGTSYTVLTRAVNAAGSGAASTSRIAAPSRTPDAPTIDSIEPSSQRLRVSVTAPAFDGGIGITNYQYSVNNGSTWVSLAPVSTTGIFSVTGLTNAQQYTVRVRAVNARGSGEASAALAATPATTPGAPVITAITPSNQSLSIAFTSGASGGAAPTNYEYSLDDGTTWNAASPASTTSPLVVSGLVNGTSYPIRIRAVNSQGAGSSSGASDGAPATVPSAPTIDAITGSNGRISIALTNGFNGGATITNYQYSTDGGTTWVTRTPSSALSPVVVGGLTNAVDYNVQVRAVNSQGPGADSSAVVGRPVTVADAPTISNIAGSPGTLTITFTSPSFDGGAALSNYEYSTDGGTTWTTRSPILLVSPLVVSGLADGTTYAVRLRAVNSQGSGVSSAMVEGTPENAPGAPLVTSMVSANQSVRVAFTAAAPRGLVVTNYQYSIDDGATWTTRSPVSVSSPLTIEDLTNGTSYQIRIRGVNARGAGLESDAVTGIPSVPPGAPTITSVIAGAASGSLDVAFTSGSTGGSPITETQYSIDGGTSWVSASQSTSPVTITGLTNGVTYTVKLRHVNLRGAGVASAGLGGVPISTPGAPTLVSVRGSNGTITAFVTPPAITGGTPVTNYEFFVDFAGSGKWVALSPASTSMPISITQFASFDNSDPDDPNPPVVTVPLVNGQTYQIKVRAVNARGVGAESEARSVKPSTTPGAPSIGLITASDSQLSLVFTSPASDGGEAIVNYQYSLDDGSTWTTRSPVSSDSPLAIGNLTNGTDYTVRVRAVNVQGPGAASSSVVARPAGAPKAPTIAAITSRSGALSVFFAQGWDNGETATNVEYSTDGSTWVTRSPASTASPVVIGGLTNGTEYPVRIRMVNIQGSGTSSAATNQTPATTPGAPSGVVVTSQNASLDTTVTAGATGGAAITSYQYSTDSGATWTSVNSANTSFTIGSLANGTLYPVVVRAVNRMGAGTASSVVNAIPSTSPDAPSISGVTSGNGRITVTFTEGFNGGSATSNVSYSLDGGSTWNPRDSASSASPIVISGLTNGTVYNLRIALVNIKGRGTQSNALAVRSATTPGAPTIDSISSNNRSLTVFVDAPADDGGDDIVNYEYSLDNGASWSQEGTAVSDGSFAITGLTNGNTYNVVVRAVNGFGAGPTSVSQQGTPATTPSMPVIGSVTPGNEQVEMNFALGPNGGAIITNIEYSIDDGATWTVRSPASLTSPLTITGLQNGVTYPIKVRAINIKGTGVASRTSGTPASAPTAPLLTRVSALDAGLRVEFESPDDNGGALITNYAYRLNGGSWIALSPASDTSPFDITGLTNGTSYSVQVAAINSQVVLSGGGANAVASNTVIQSPARRPGAPVIGGSTVSDGTINIGFTLPDTGGRTISALDYSLDGGDSWVTQLAAQSPIVVQGLANGTPYQVQLRARNELGVGAVSSSTQLIPSRAPFAPTIQSIGRGDTTLTMAYQLGANGGAAVSDVEYSIDGGVNWLQQSTASVVSPLRISSLVNGTQYTVKLRAVNIQGSGDASVSSTGTPVGVPSAPTLTTAARGNQIATLTFTLGAANGGTTSNIEYSVDNGASWVTRSPASVLSPFTIAGLTNGSAYTVRIRSLNEMGASSASASSSVTPATTPSVPTITSAIGEDTRMSIAFAPNADGGSAISNYAYSIDDGQTWTTRSPASTSGPLVVTGLVNGTSYALQLKAINDVGQSSATSSVGVLPSGPPTAPTISSVTGSNEALSIAFVQGSNGGSPITAYEVSTDNGFTWTRTQTLASPLVVGGLVNGAAYSVAIRAVNSRGVGQASTAAQGTPATIPDAPQVTEVISDNGAVHVAFAYGNTGGSAVSNVEYSLDDGQTWITRSPASTSRPLTITGLTNGVNYDVRLRSVNQIGVSSPSEVVDALPATIPGVVTVNSLQSGNGMLDVHFTAPQDNGGAPITYYQYSLDGGATWADSVSTVSPIEVTGLTVGTEYNVELRAVNLRGPGLVATAATAKRVTAPPAPPTITDIETGDSFVSVRYAPPIDTGGTTLDRFYFSLDGGNTWTLITNSVQANSMSFAASMTIGTRTVYALSSPSTQMLMVTGLTNGTDYRIALRGAHPEALGVPSVPRTAAPSTTPDEVENLEVESLDQALAISFDAPIVDGGSSISGYQYSLNNGSTWVDVPQNPFVVNGLINGITYNVGVRATNHNGEGVVLSLSAKPATTASVPTNVRAVAGELSAQLTWDQPTSDGGSAITDYIIEYSTNSGSTWTTLNDAISTIRSIQILSLQSNATYVFRVTPVNIAGRGAPSVVSNAVTPTAPVVPVAPVAPVVPIAKSPIKPVVIPVVEEKPVAPIIKQRPNVPVVTPSVVERLPDSGGVQVAPGVAVSLINGVPRVVNFLVEDSGAAVIETVGEFVIRVAPLNEEGQGVMPNQSGELQAIKGRLIEFSGQGFAPNSSVEVWINSSPILLGEVNTDDNGSFTAEFELPIGVVAGAHTLTLKGLGINAEELVTSLGLKVIEDELDNSPDNTPDSGSGGADESTSDGGLPFAPLGAGLLLLLAMAGYIAVRRARVTSP